MSESPQQYQADQAAFEALVKAVDGATLPLWRWGQLAAHIEKTKLISGLGGGMPLYYADSQVAASWLSAARLAPVCEPAPVIPHAVAGCSDQEGSAHHQQLLDMMEQIDALGWGEEYLKAGKFAFEIKLLEQKLGHRVSAAALAVALMDREQEAG